MSRALTYTYSSPLRDDLITILEDLEKGGETLTDRLGYIARAAALLVRIDHEESAGGVRFDPVDGAA